MQLASLLFFVIYHFILHPFKQTSFFAPHGCFFAHEMHEIRVDTQ